MTRRLIAVLTIVVTCGVGVAVARDVTGGSAGSAGATKCGNWPTTAEGRPASSPGGGARYLIWHDQAAWHLRAVTPKGQPRARFRGRISTKGAIRQVRSRDREAGDVLTRSKRRISFDFSARGGDKDSIDFTVLCGPISFDLQPASRTVQLGATGPAPATSFTAPDPGASGVRGRVVTGPVCPVEGTGMDCTPRPIQTTVDIFAAPASRTDPVPSTPQRSVATSASGDFAIALAPGEYRFVPRSVEPGASGQPANVTVTSGVTTEVTLIVDTGLRLPGGGPSGGPDGVPSGTP